MINTIAIVGAGLMGRLLALSLHRQGFKVSLFDKDKQDAKNSAAYAAAGLLTPLGESPQCEKNIVDMGIASLALWPKILSTLEQPVYFQQQGSIVVSHEQDQGDYLRFERFINSHYQEHVMQKLDRAELLALEPELATTFKQGLYLPDEGQIDNKQLLTALAWQIKHEGIHWLSETLVSKMVITEQGHEVFFQCLKKQSLKRPSLKNPSLTNHNTDNHYHIRTFDLVIDCRGTGAMNVVTEKQENNAQKTSNSSNSSSSDSNNKKPNHTLANLRAVRGEVFKLYAPEVKLTRPIRLTHPRYQLYIAPKENGYFSIGATQIESEDNSPITVRSAMELLSAAYSIHSGFAEANILENISQLRPAFDDNQPKILAHKQLIQVNGLYRHGYLISPVVLNQVLEFISNMQQQKPLETPCRYSVLLPITITDTITSH